MFRKDTLENGIRVVSERVPTANSVSVGVWVNVGSRDEPSERNGIAHFIEHMFFKGTGRRTAREIAGEVDSIGGELNAFTSREETTFYARVLDKHLSVAIDLLSDIFLNSILDPKEIEKEKGIILEEIRIVEDTPDDYIHDLYYRVAWANNPLGQSVLGRKEVIASLRREDLIDHLEGHYCPENVVISSAGNFDPDELLGLLNKGFGRLNRGNSSLKGGSPPTFLSNIHGEKKGLESVHLCLGVEGMKYTHEDRYGLFVLNTILGSSVSSRLFQEIRERRGLAYSIFSYLVFYRDTGMLTVYAAVDRKKVEEVIDIILKGFINLKNKMVTPEELRKAKEHLKGNILLSLESTINKMSQIARQEIYFGRYFSIEEILSSIEAVTSEEVQRLGQALFKKDSIALTTVGPFNIEDLRLPLMLEPT